MQNVPKIVRERLKAATPPAHHPDANVLTAFAERTLGEDERGLVLEHLARCGDCRDIVALALPATEPAGHAIKVPASGWLTWPALRWGLVAAGVVAIAALGVVQYQRRTETAASKPPAPFAIAAKEARNQPLATPGPAAASKKADNLQTPPPAIADSVDARPATANGATRMVAEPSPPTAAPNGSVGGSSALVVGGALPHGPRLANQWQQQNGAQNQAPTPAAPSPFAKQQVAGNLAPNLRVPAVAERVAVENQSAQLDAQAQDLNAIQVQDGHQVEEGQSQVAEGQSKDQAAAEQQSAEDFSARVGKAKPAEAVPSGYAGAVVRGTTIGGPMLTSSIQAPRWTINATGGLQRSFDQGATWQSVDVNANPASFTDATSIQIVGKTSHAKARKMPSLMFRAVAATGTDVWAGGSGGALYHSTDAGDHWTRVVPGSADAILTGDVVTLEFIDMRHGKVSTSTAEVWTTSDDGQTWQRQ
jgi:photosynthesis system II assembly factor YCF48-like protein/putative zinc finger protein